MDELRLVKIDFGKLEKRAGEIDFRNIRHEDVCGAKTHEERTECCNAPVIMRTGGLAGYVCSDCGKPYNPLMFRPLK